MTGESLQVIRQAFERREFFLEYQPIVSLADGRCLGAEALTRWRRADGSVSDAHAFMPSTDRTPLSGLITYWVIDTVAEQLGPWLDAHPEALIAINVPPEILGRGGLEYAAVKSGLRARARQVILEITERGIPDQLGLEALNAIPATGVRIALDDTTLSGANLALLMRCHFDFVKIDHALVHELGRDGEGPLPSWLTGLSALFGATALQVIAEGIESNAQALRLQAAGVQWGQGRHLSPPLSIDGFMRYYDRAAAGR
jgi:sensor c-di-GMP phosphodiesterase-like protein